MTRKAIVLLSGGLDSAVALLWAIKHYDHVDAISFDYGQVAAGPELTAAGRVWSLALNTFVSDKIVPRMPPAVWTTIKLPDSMFASNASILGRSEINQYETVEEAVQNTPNDRSYIPLRNALFITIAAHHLLARFPDGGAVVVGVRSRSDPGAPAGYPDCTSEFAGAMTDCLSTGAGVPVMIHDPLNHRSVPSREDTIGYAIAMSPYGLDFIARTVTCFSGNRCGKCLPCQRRNQAFEAVGIEDPAIKYWKENP
jgi:7-cyano-7-deazaguanine synthase